MDVGDEIKLGGERRLKACGRSDKCPTANGDKDLY